MQETLKQGLSVPFFGAISADETLYQGTIYFTPKPGHEGKKAEFSVEVSAEVPTNTGLQEVKPSKTINGDIDVINLSECIKVTPDHKIYTKGKQEKKATRRRVWIYFGN